MTSDLLNFIRMGGELELPVGLMNRMVAAGYVFPYGEDAALDALIEIVFNSTNRDGMETDVAAAAALQAQGVFKKS